MAGKYRVQVARSARKQLESLDNALIARIVSHIDALVNNPRPRGCRKLRGENNLWRLRVGDYRVIYAISDRERVVDISAVRNRREAYD